jgi:hypothetical protein
MRSLFLTLNFSDPVGEKFKEERRVRKRLQDILKGDMP